MKAIGLDIGTTSICGVLMNCETGAVERTVNCPNDTWLVGTYSWEKLQNPSAIRERAENILSELNDPDAAAIGVTGQMHGIVYLDGEGEAVSPLYTWQDGRGNQPYGNGTYASHLGSHTGYGNVTHFYNSVNGLVPERASVFCTIHDYVAMNLAERASPLVHISDGASFGLYDTEKNSFLQSDALQPALTETETVLGERNGAAVAVAIGDNQAGFLGGGCDSQTLLVNIGTGSQVSFECRTIPTKSELELRPLSGERKLLVGSSLCGGRAYALLERFFRLAAAMAGVRTDSLYEAMEQAAKETPETELEFETFFCGTRAEPNRRAEIRGLGSENFTPGNLVRGCMRGIAAELLELYKSGGADCTRLVGTGNGIRRNSTLRKILENMFGMNMQVPRFREEAAAGAAIFAMTAAGIYENLEEAERIVNYESI